MDEHIAKFELMVSRGIGAAINGMPQKEIGKGAAVIRTINS
ncbi:hypothetical protein [Dyadobacter aurulentus]|nr:hypothetical protein [Dyadobacter sp. UC 10]